MKRPHPIRNVGKALSPSSILCWQASPLQLARQVVEDNNFVHQFVTTNYSQSRLLLKFGAITRESPRCLKLLRGVSPHLSWTQSNRKRNGTLASLTSLVSCCAVPAGCVQCLIVHYLAAPRVDGKLERATGCRERYGGVPGSSQSKLHKAFPALHNLS